MDKKVENCYKDNSEKDVYVELLQWNCIYLYHIVVSTRNCFARILQNICSEVFMNRKNNENNKSDSIGNSNIPVKQDIPDLFHIEEYKMLREEFIAKHIGVRHQKLQIKVLWKFNKVHPG